MTLSRVVLRIPVSLILSAEDSCFPYSLRFSLKVALSWNNQRSTEGLGKTDRAFERERERER